jgi:hypothetical protein
MNDYLSKPIQIEALIAMLEHYGAAHAVSPANVAMSGGRQPGLSAPEKSNPEISPVLDPGALAKLKQMLGHQSAYLKEFIDAILQTAPQRLTELQQALRRENLAELRLAATVSNPIAPILAPAGFSSCAGNWKPVPKPAH